MWWPTCHFRHGSELQQSMQVYGTTGYHCVLPSWAIMTACKKSAVWWSMLWQCDIRYSLLCLVARPWLLIKGPIWTAPCFRCVILAVTAALAQKSGGGMHIASTSLWDDKTDGIVSSTNHESIEHSPSVLVPFQVLHSHHLCEVISGCHDYQTITPDFPRANNHLWQVADVEIASRQVIPSVPCLPARFGTRARLRILDPS